MMKRYPWIGNVNGLQVGKSVDLRNAALFIKTKTAGVANDSQTPCDVWTLIKFGEGNFSYTESEAFEYERDRGKLDDVNFGDESPVTFSLEGKATFVSSLSTENATIHEIVKGVDYATQLMKFAGTGEPWLQNYGCIPYAFEMELHIIPQLECPTLTVLGEAFLFRYSRIPSIELSMSTRRVNAGNGESHCIRPFVIRPDFASIYAAELAGGKLRPADLMPLQDKGVLWPKDPREA